MFVFLNLLIAVKAVNIYILQKLGETEYTWTCVKCNYINPS